MSKNFYQIKALSESKAEILIYEQIGEDFWTGGGVTGKTFAADLKALGDVTNIDVRLNSPGGNVFDGLTIYNILRAHKATIDVYVDGIAASIASVIAMAGDTIHMPKNSMMMVHDPSVFASGNSEEMRKTADFLDKIKESLLSAYTEKTGKDHDEVWDLLKDETWMSAEECVEMGFADNLVESVQIAAKFNLSVYDHAPIFNKQNLLGGTKPGGYMPAPGAGLQNVGNDETEDIDMSVNKDSSKQAVSDFIAKDHPAVADELKEQGAKAAHDAAFKAGADAERLRINAVEEQLVPGCEELIKTLVADGKTSGPEAAVQVLKAVKAEGANVLETLRNEGAETVTTVVSNDLDGGADTFESLVEKHVEAGMSKGKAIKAVAKSHSKLHAKYIEQQNGGEK